MPVMSTQPIVISTTFVVPRYPPPGLRRARLGRLPSRCSAECQGALDSVLGAVPQDSGSVVAYDAGVVGACEAEERERRPRGRGLVLREEKRDSTEAGMLETWAWDGWRCGRSESVSQASFWPVSIVRLSCTLSSSR